MQTAIEFTGTFINRKQGDGYMAFLKELPAVATEGDTLDEASQNLMKMLPDVWALTQEIADEQQIINGENDVPFTTQKFPFVPA